MGEDYLPDYAAANLGLSVCDFSLDGAACVDGGPRFISPTTWAQLDAHLATSKCVKEEGLELPPMNDKNTPDLTDPHFPRSLAWDVVDSLIRYPCNDSRFHRSNWYFGDHWVAAHGPEDDMCLNPRNMKNPRCPWVCPYITHPTNPKLPHFHAFIADRAPLLADGPLKTGEAVVGLGLLKERRIECPEFANSPYIPVTVFSVACRQVRVVQFWHDRTKPKQIFVRRSPIFDFTDGERAHWDDWLTLLCYFVGKPVIEKQ